MLEQVHPIVEGALTATSAHDAAGRFADALSATDASYVQARLYRRPAGALTAIKHWDAGGVLVRRAVPGWVGSSGFDYICFVRNPLLEPIRRGVTQYRFSDYAPHGDHAYRDYWDAFGQAAIGDAICGTAYGRDGTIASAHVGMPDRDVAPRTAAVIGLAANIVCQRLIGFAAPAAAPAEPRLSERERDAMAFVADGKTDWEIATIMGIAETTARFHVDNARRKLDATNRAHAVARFVARYGAG